MLINMETYTDEYGTVSERKIVIYDSLLALIVFLLNLIGINLGQL